ncbi:MAG: hypothetical protein K6E21_04750 [Bacilli bacterium]|nr:hypothetical protein [Bacilli bacterium]
MGEEKRVTLKDIIKLLLGNKWIYLFMLATFFVASMVGLNIYSSSNKEYSSFFNYNVAGFTYDENSGTFIDGEKFDTHSLITKDKITSYLQSNEILKSISYEDLIENNGIKSFGYKIEYEKNDHVMNDVDNKYLESKRGFELVLNSKAFSKEQAKVFAGIVAKQVIEISKEKVESINYSAFLKNYINANSYSDKVTSLESGIELINNKCMDLQNVYGDVAITSGNYGGEEEKYYVDSQNISEWLEDMNICFKGYFVNSLAKELELGGFIREESRDYIVFLKTSIENLNREIAVNESILSDLKNQRDDFISMISSTSTIVNLEIGEYNSEIISLTKEIAKQKEQLAIYNLQLDKLNTSTMTNEELQNYNRSLEEFENKLNLVYDKLDFYTKQFEAVSKKIMNDNMAVFYESSDIVDLQGGMKFTTIAMLSAAIGFFAPMVVNIVIACFKEAEGKLDFIKNKSN